MRKISFRISGSILALSLLAALMISLVNISYADTPKIPVSLDISSVAEPGGLYSINDAEGLYLLAQKVNAGESMSGVQIVLTADITLNGGSFSPDGTWSEGGSPAVWTPIGNNLAPFSGTFDGGGHTISGLYRESEGGFVGLFGHIVDGSVVNLNIKNSYVSGEYYVGGIVGFYLSLKNDCRIDNCDVEVYTSTHNYFVGAVAGYAASAGGGSIEISNCATVSNARVVGAAMDGVRVVADNSETIIGPQAGGDENNLIWLWILLIILLLAGATLILLLVLRKKNKNGEKLPAEAEEKAGVTATAEATESETTDESEAAAEPEAEKTGEAKVTSESEAEESEAAAEPEGEPEEERAAEPEEKPVDDSIAFVEAPSAVDAAEDRKASATAAAVLATPSGPRSGALGYYYIKQTANGGYMFNLKAANHEIIATSEVYASLAACKKGIQSVAKNAAAAVIDDQTDLIEEKVYAPKFEIYTDKSGNFRFRLKAANYEIIAVSQAYKKKPSCRNAIDSVIRNSETRKIIIEDSETGKKRENLRAEIVKAVKITPEEANSLIDDTAADLLIETIDSEEGQIKKYDCVTVHTDTLGENFEAADIVNTETLIRKNLIPHNTRHIRVEARGTLDKALSVEANQFSTEAVKMIILTGGTAVRTND